MNHFSYRIHAAAGLDLGRQRVDLPARADSAPTRLRSETQHRAAEQHTRRAEQWQTSRLRMNGVLHTELPVLRDRSRWADDNDAHYGGLLDKLLFRVVGGGIRPQSRIREIRDPDSGSILLADADAMALSRQLEAAWRRWSTAAGIDGVHLHELQELVVRHFLLDGDGLAVIGTDALKDDELPLIVDVPNPARLDTPPREVGNPRIIMGIELDARGRRLRYHFAEEEPSDVAGGWNVAFEAVAAWRVGHLYYRRQAGQIRGTPLGHRVLSRIRDLLDLEEIEMIGAQAAASHVGTIETDDPYGEAEASAAETRNGALIEDVVPGTWRYLRRGEKAHLLTPARPGNAFEPFAAHELRAIGAGMNAPYELLTGDLSRVNYLSGRLGLLALREYVRWIQRRLIERVCWPIWRHFCDRAVALGLVDVSPRFYREHRWLLQAAGWITPSAPMLDEIKETTAAVLRVNNNLTSKRRIVEEQTGEDWDEIMDERYEERRREKEFDLEPPNLPGAQGVKPSNAGIDGSQDQADEAAATPEVIG